MLLLLVFGVGGGFAVVALIVAVVVAAVVAAVVAVVGC